MTPLFCANVDIGVIVRRPAMQPFKPDISVDFQEQTVCKDTALDSSIVFFSLDFESELVEMDKGSTDSHRKWR